MCSSTPISGTLQCIFDGTILLAGARTFQPRWDCRLWRYRCLFSWERDGPASGPSSDLGWTHSRDWRSPRRWGGGSTRWCFGLRRAGVRTHLNGVLLAPGGRSCRFSFGRRLSAGRNKMERRIATVQSTTGAVMIGGGAGTADEVLLPVLEAIMNGYCLIPAVGTGGVAGRIYRGILRLKRRSE
jgi:hypothetical protein